MQRNQPQNRSNRLFILLLVMSVALNGTQAVVLCMGSEKHVAIKWFGHRHGHNEHKSKEVSHESSNGTEDQDTPRQPCVDVPLSSGISENPGMQKVLMSIAFFVGIVPYRSDVDDPGCETDALAGGAPVFISFYKPLNNIILIV